MSNPTCTAPPRKVTYKEALSEWLASSQPLSDRPANDFSFITFLDEKVRTGTYHESAINLSLRREDGGQG